MEKLIGKKVFSKAINYDDLDRFIETVNENIEKNSYIDKPQYIKKRNIVETSKIQKIKSIANYTLISPIEIFYKMKYENFHKLHDDEEKCTICLDTFYEIDKNTSLIDANTKHQKSILDTIMIDDCVDHFYHIDCLINMIGDKNHMKCPICLRIYGILEGDQPPGTMSAFIDQHNKCKGYENYNTIVIEYNFKRGKNYSGTYRVAYLPACEEGYKVLGLLKVSFDRKLTFTVGTSVTTGQTNTTVWNGIHHKTNLNGGSAYFGYPDKTYFSRVQEEMAAKGVRADNLGKKPEDIGREFLIACQNNKFKY